MSEIVGMCRLPLNCKRLTVCIKPMRPMVEEMRLQLRHNPSALNSKNRMFILKTS